MKIANLEFLSTLNLKLFTDEKLQINHTQKEIYMSAVAQVLMHKFSS